MNEIKIFEEDQIRSMWIEEEQQWYFSVVDVCDALAESKAKRKGTYWNVLKNRLNAEGSQLLSKTNYVEIPEAVQRKGLGKERSVPVLPDAGDDDKK